ncbi:MAG: sigma-70 family RNA polymerase sigma factor, partial [Planctomycetales bacterium]|nr:sigma-70 family RNA polymerase sigma factor [Planctomycetales bacterium]
MSNLNSQELLQLYREGHNEAATTLFNKYARRLIALARKRISPKLNRRIDADDVVQSAYRSFFAHAKDDEYQLTTAGDLWRLLASITLHKLHGQVDKHTAAKRSVNHEEAADATTGSARSPEPTPEEAAALIEDLQIALKALTPDERCVLTGTLQGQGETQLASTVKKSNRTVRRLLASARQKIEHQLLSTYAVEGRTASSPEEHAAPLQYSDYVLEKLLGSGGMGKVYRARTKRTGNMVAIKALHKVRQTDRRSVTRFVQESHLLTKLTHPGIVRVEGLGRFPGGGYFMVMEYIDGVDLQSQLESELFSLQDALEMVDRVAHAINYAHDNGIVHCDLKPGNILRRSNGDVLVTDFGFACLLSEFDGMASNSVGGTAGYI